MRRIIALLVIGFLTLGINQVSGQSLRDLVKKKNDSTEESAEDKAKDETTDKSGGLAKKAIREGVDKRLDRIFGTTSDDDDKSSGKSVSEDVSANEAEDTDDRGSSSSSSGSAFGMNALMSGLGMSGSADVKEVYKFDAFIEMTIINYDKDGEESDPGKYTTFLDADSPDYGISFVDEDQDGEMMMIFDTENSLMLTLIESDGEKTGFAVAFTEDQQEAIEEYEEEEIEEAEANAYNIKKTGKTKKILGYKCDEYVTEDENTIIRMWVTDDLGKKVNKTFMKNAQFGNIFTYAYFTKGFVMESEAENKDDQERSVMTVTDIDVDNVTSIKTGGYTIMNMGAMEGMMEEEEEEE